MTHQPRIASDCPVWEAAAYLELRNGYTTDYEPGTRYASMMVLHQFYPILDSTIYTIVTKDPDRTYLDDWLEAICPFILEKFLESHPHIGSQLENGTHPYPVFFMRNISAALKASQTRRYNPSTIRAFKSGLRYPFDPNQIEPGWGAFLAEGGLTTVFGSKLDLMRDAIETMQIIQSSTRVEPAPLRAWFDRQFSDAEFGLGSMNSYCPAITPMKRFCASAVVQMAGFMGELPISAPAIHGRTFREVDDIFRDYGSLA